jgi:hypothetical protein
MNPIKEKLIDLVGKTIVFKENIEAWETYADEGMRAVVLKFTFDHSPNDPCHKIFVDFSKFEAENHKRQNANYYDDRGIPCLTAVEAGQYTAMEDFYLDHDPETWPFEAVEE